MALPTLAERAGRRVISVWRPTVAWILLGFVLAGIYAFIFLQSAFKTTLFSRADLGPSILGGGLMVMGYATAVVTEERVKVGLYCSVVIFLTFHVTGAIARIVLGCAAVAFAPRRGEREKIRSAVFTTKASVAADRGRLRAGRALSTFARRARSSSWLAGLACSAPIPPAARRVIAKKTRSSTATRTRGRSYGDSRRGMGSNHIYRGSSV